MLRQEQMKVEKMKKGKTSLRKLMMVLALVLVAATFAAVPAMAQTTPEQTTGGDQAQAERQKDPGAKGFNVRNRGSDTTYGLIQTLASVYNFAGEDANPNNDRILTAPPKGSSVGIDNLADQSVKTDFARSSRGPSDDDPEGLNFIAFARDGIVPVTFGDLEDPEAADAPSVGVENLTIEQLRGIFVDCTITNFNQIGGNNGQIRPFAIQAGSGTRATFDALIGGNSENCLENPDDIIFENSAGPINDLSEEEQRRAIFAFSFGRLQQTGGGEGDVNPLSVNGVDADADTIGNGTFPLSRDLFNVTQDKEKSTLR